MAKLDHMRAPTAPIVMRKSPPPITEALTWLRQRFPSLKPEGEILIGQIGESLARLETIECRETLNILWQVFLASHYLTGAVGPNAQAKAQNLNTVSNLLTLTDNFFKAAPPQKGTI
jgi:hypothetical protein